MIAIVQLKSNQTGKVVEVTVEHHKPLKITQAIRYAKEEMNIPSHWRAVAIIRDH